MAVVHRETPLDQLRHAKWTKPINGGEALYPTSHAFKIEGMPNGKSTVLIEELITFARNLNVYSHTWNFYDVLIWDERATMRRGTPWTHGEAGTLSSICSSVTIEDRPDDASV